MLTAGKVVKIPKDTMLAAIDGSPAVAQALWWTTLVDEAVLREWLVNIGGRDALARIAHLICELHVRMGNVRLVTNGEMHLPLTQTDLAESLGLTSVHVNRMLRQLRQPDHVQIVPVEYPGPRRSDRGGRVSPGISARTTTGADDRRWTGLAEPERSLGRTSMNRSRPVRYDGRISQAFRCSGSEGLYNFAHREGDAKILKLGPTFASGR